MSIPETKRNYPIPPAEKNEEKRAAAVRVQSSLSRENHENAKGKIPAEEGAIFQKPEIF